MNILLENNSFTMDTRESRLTRLQLLKTNIELFASELSIMPEILDWALLAYDEFSNLLNQQNLIFREKNERFNLINENEKEFFQRLISFREIIYSQVSDSKLLTKLKLNEQIPTSRIDKIEFASDFISKIRNNDSFTFNEMSKLVLENLSKQLEILKISYGEALSLQDKGTNITNSLNNRFDQDSINLRTLFNWCVIFWNKKDPKLMELGFTIPKSTAKNALTPEKIVEFKLEHNLISWKKSEKAEKYQLVFRNKFENVEWKILSLNDELKHEIKVTPGEYKVRGLNKNGFGEWSELILINENNEIIIENK